MSVVVAYLLPTGPHAKRRSGLEGAGSGKVTAENEPPGGLMYIGLGTLILIIILLIILF